MQPASTRPVVVEVQSEVGRLEAVILHRPGAEVAHMTPATAERALYSDILNLGVAAQEYDQLQQVLGRWARTFQVRDLLQDVLVGEAARRTVIDGVCQQERVPGLAAFLHDLDPAELTRRLIEGVPLVRDNLTRFLSPERFSLPPLHNFFFTRDAAMAVGKRVLIGRMASKVRSREALIMEAIFDHHPALKAATLNPARLPGAGDDITIEGGDVLVARHDVLLVGIGARTSSQAVDFLLEHLAPGPEPHHVLVQELPREPESFIHLDMAFTLLDRDACLVYAPLILDHNRYETVHIRFEGGKVAEIRAVENLMVGLRGVGLDLEPVPCGDPDDQWIQEREQWHSGTNVFALAPGKVVGYARNEHTLAQLDRRGFAVLPAADVIAGRADPDAHRRCVVTIGGSELARGGGGCRCMTLPVARGAVD